MKPFKANALRKTDECPAPSRVAREREVYVVSSLGGLTCTAPPLPGHTHTQIEVHKYTSYILSRQWIKRIKLVCLTVHRGLYKLRLLQIDELLCILLLQATPRDALKLDSGIVFG